MKSKMILASVPLMAMLIIVMPVPTAFACDPPLSGIDWRYTWCMIQEGYPLPATPTPVAPILPRGDSPYSARDISDTWQVLDPGTSLWLKTPNSDGFRVLEFWLETATPNTIGLAFYSPDQFEGLNTSTNPIGRGTHSNSDPETLIRWKASYAKPGTWYILLSNNTNAPAPYKLNHNMQSTAVKKCISYWETLHGQPVLWTDCGFYTGPKD